MHITIAVGVYRGGIMDRDVIWDEINLLQNSLITIWRAYMRWFSWHFGIHIGAIGASLSIDGLQQRAIEVSTFMAFFGLLGVGAALKMHEYDEAVRMRVEAIRGNSEASNSALLGGNVLRYARRATLTTNGLIILVWCYVGITAWLKPFVP
jgi:hypothetical protein